MTHPQAEALLKKALQTLGDQFDHVQILVSWDQEGKSSFRAQGCGNSYARLGMVHTYLDMISAEGIAVEIGNVLPLEDGEEG